MGADTKSAARLANIIEALKDVEGFFQGAAAQTYEIEKRQLYVRRMEELNAARMLVQAYRDAPVKRFDFGILFDEKDGVG